MKPTPLLDFWQKPANAGSPVAMLATTFALEPDFFEQNCLARFLEISAVNEDTGSIEDIVASVELQEYLRDIQVTVLADRSAPGHRTSLFWDLLGCKVRGGLLHAKVSVLIWENAVRVILGSANLTSAGYRRQIELGLAADLGPTCLFPPTVLHAIADELQSYLELVPGYAAEATAFRQAELTLAQFRQRIDSQEVGSNPVRVAFAPTNAKSSPLDQLKSVWSGAQPVRAKHLSPFWDSGDDERTVLKATQRLLTGRPPGERSVTVAVVLGPRGETDFSHHLAEGVDEVRELKVSDDEIRTLHAKCLLFQSNDWIAALIGSSNHTKAGLGLKRNGRHREMNVWLGAPIRSDAGKALLSLIELGKRVPVDAQVVVQSDEDEATVATPLPTCFGLLQIKRGSDANAWQLHLGIVADSEMPEQWEIALAPGAPSCWTREQWTANNKPHITVIDWTAEALPMYIVVRWGSEEAQWATLAYDRYQLPPGAEIAKLGAEHLLKALATGKSVSQMLRAELERRASVITTRTGMNLNPLQRFESPGSLLRKGRALAASLSAMQRRLERPIFSVETLRARLLSPLGPEFVALKVFEAAEGVPKARVEAAFTIAEIALSVGRVDWARVLEHVDMEEGLGFVHNTIEQLVTLLNRIDDVPDDVLSYSHRAIKETRQCLRF